MSSQRRLRKLLKHIGSPTHAGGKRLNERGAEEASTAPVAPAPIAAPAAPAPAAASAIDVGSGLAALDERPTRLLNDQQVQEFIRSGWMSIGPDEIGLAPQTVEQIYADGCRWHDNARDAIEDPRTGRVHPMSSDNLLSEMPGLQDVCRSPAVHGALQSLLGKGYMLHPHGGFHAKPAGSGGQTFHKDGFFPGNGHGLRYHRPEYLLFFYYPQETHELMGPTEILPQSQYLSNDSEVEDSHPLVGRLISGDAAAGAGAADAAGSAGAQLYSGAVTELGWPNRVERLTVPAGTVVITHFDVFHRGTHGPHDGQPHRLMLKLWYTRGQDNTGGPSWDHTPAEDDQAPAIFRETRPPAADVEGQAVIWDTMWRWMLGVPPPTLESDAATIAMLRERAAATRNDGSVSDAAVEPLRVSAAYQLAEMGDAGAEVLLEMLLGPDRLSGPSSVAEFGEHGWGPLRSAAYALSSSPAAAAVPALAAAARTSPLREVRALAVFCLGQSVSDDVLCVEPAIEAMNDDSGFVRATAAAALGFAGRRLAAAGGQARKAAVAKCVEALASAVGRDDIANDFFGAGEGQPPFHGSAASNEAINTVRSAVRENAAISLSMLATVAAADSDDLGLGPAWKAAAEVLGHVLQDDLNKFVHAFAHETVRRLYAASPQAGGHFGRVWEEFEGSERWRPPHFQIACEFLSDPSEFLFVEGGRGKNQMS